MNSAFWHPRFMSSLRISNELCAGNTDSHFRCGFILDSAFWHPRFASSLRISNELSVLASQIRVFISNEFFVLAPQIHVFATDFLWILLSGIPDSRFRCGFIMNYTFWHPRFAFSLRIYKELYVPARQIRVFATDF